MLDVRTSGEDMTESSRATVLLRPVDGGTRLDLTVEGLSGADAAEGMLSGWEWCVDGLAGLLEPAG